VHTGGRNKNHHGNTSAGNSFSPLLHTTGNLINTPNQHHSATHRFEDLQQLYDNILEEEDKIKMKKKKKGGEDGGLKKGGEEISGGESQDYDESMFLDEDDDDGMHMFDEEDMDDLQSYRNHQQDIEDGQETNPEFLNEGTADFGGLLKEITKEIDDELGAEPNTNLQGGANTHQAPIVIPEHL
jgi:hypothetical protein